VIVGGFFFGLGVHRRRMVVEYPTTIVVVTFIGGDNRSIQRKLPTYRKSLTNFIT
jgi:hypothetical protein